MDYAYPHLIITYDKSKNNEKSRINIGKFTKNDGFQIINTFIGDKADKLYQLLTNKNLCDLI